MRIEVKCDILDMENEGINKILEIIKDKGRLHIEINNGIMIIDEFQKHKINTILKVIKEYFEFTILDIVEEQINNEEIIKQKIAWLRANIEESNSLSAKIKGYILQKDIFTLQELREQFPDDNHENFNSYIRDLKRKGIVYSIARGKYGVRYVENIGESDYM